MSRSRRFLPSISLLTAFEAVLQEGSTAAAARELALSQGTVSRLIQNLEQQLGHQLFERHRQKLVPTEAAKNYGRDITQALDFLQRASLELVANPGGGTLSLAVLPTFGARWLAPRLVGFAVRHPGVTISLATRFRRFHFASEGFDAAIYFGDGDWSDAGHMKLFDEHLTACVAPSLLRRHAISNADDLRPLPLLRLETRPTAWAIWFEAQGEKLRDDHGMLVDQFATMIQAAIAGFGVALLPDYLAAMEIEEGRLVPILKPSVTGTGAYWISWPARASRYPPLLAFKSWLEEEVTVAGSNFSKPAGKTA